MHHAYAEMVALVGRALDASASLAVGAHHYDIFARGEADFGFI